MLADTVHYHNIKMYYLLTLPSGFGRPIGATIDRHYFAMGCFVFFNNTTFPGVFYCLL